MEHVVLMSKVQRKSLQNGTQNRSQSDGKPKLRRSGAFRTPCGAEKRSRGARRTQLWGIWAPPERFGPLFWRELGANGCQNPAPRQQSMQKNKQRKYREGSNERKKNQIRNERPRWDQQIDFMLVFPIESRFRPFWSRPENRHENDAKNDAKEHTRAIIWHQGDIFLRLLCDLWGIRFVPMSRMGNLGAKGRQRWPPSGQEGAPGEGDPV